MTPDWLVIARRELGTTEIPGEDHNSRILEYHSTVAGSPKSDEVPWCSSFVQWCLAMAGIEGTGLALARSWLKWGRPLEYPRAGAIYVKKRGQSTWQGHVGFWVGGEGPYDYVLGGNQRNMVRISRYPRRQMLGMRWPIDGDTKERW